LRSELLHMSDGAPPDAFDVPYFRTAAPEDAIEDVPEGTIERVAS